MLVGARLESVDNQFTGEAMKQRTLQCYSRANMARSQSTGIRSGQSRNYGTVAY